MAGREETFRVEVSATVNGMILELAAATHENVLIGISHNTVFLTFFRSIHLVGALIK